jgi:hypothetical protein
MRFAGLLSDAGACARKDARTRVLRAPPAGLSRTTSSTPRSAESRGSSQASTTRRSPARSYTLTRRRCRPIASFPRHWRGSSRRSAGLEHRPAQPGSPSSASTPMGIRNLGKQVSRPHPASPYEDDSQATSSSSPAGDPSRSRFWGPYLGQVRVQRVGNASRGYVHART